MAALNHFSHCLLLVTAMIVGMYTCITKMWVTFASAWGLDAQRQSLRSSWTSSSYRAWTNKWQKHCSTFQSIFGVLEVKGDPYRVCTKQGIITAKKCALRLHAQNGPPWSSYQIIELEWVDWRNIALPSSLCPRSERCPRCPMQSLWKTEE